jgi:hypothetical protein
VLKLPDIARRKYEVEVYTRLKGNKYNSSKYYAVDGDWVTDWLKFLQKEGSFPGEIDNMRL